MITTFCLSLGIIAMAFMVAALAWWIFLKVLDILSQHKE